MEKFAFDCQFLKLPPTCSLKKSSQWNHVSMTSMKTLILTLNCLVLPKAQLLLGFYIEVLLFLLIKTRRYCYCTLFKIISHSTFHCFYHFSFSFSIFSFSFCSLFYKNYFRFVNPYVFLTF